MAPEYQTDPGFTFLGARFRNGPTVNPQMRQKLIEVEAKLSAIHAEHGIAESLQGWCGIREEHVGWRAGAGHHTSGCAIDINVTLNPYIVTRTGSTLGGEAAADGQPEMRRRAIEVCDRAMRFSWSSQDYADLSIRVNDPIEVTYDRFAVVSESLQTYLGVVFGDQLSTINRRPIPDAHLVPDGDSRFDAIGTDEVWRDTDRDTARDEAIADLRDLMTSKGWQAEHPDWPYTPEQQYWQILRDYELVRIPMLHGSPADPVTATRNPAKGFLHLGRDLVCQLVRTGGFRWGASDFGARHSGDVMHFDMG